MAAEADVLSSAASANASSIAGSGAAAAITSKPLISVVIMLVLAALIGHFFSPQLDKSEPPALKSRIPIIGHLISMIKDQADFLSLLP